LRSPHWAAGAFACLRDWLAPAIVGRTIDTGDALQEQLACFRGNQYAKAALDTAWWDLHARLQQQPLARVLGGQREAVEVGVGFDQMDSIDRFLTLIGRAVDAGFARVELKLRPGWDLQMLRAVRQEFPAQTFHVDCEGGLRLEYIDTLYRLDDFGLAMVEQPLPPDDLVGHAMVQESLRTPVCLDESITTLEQADMAVELRSCRYVNIQPGRVGGLTPALAIHDACQQQGIPCWVGTPPQTSVGARIGWALATKPNFTYPADYGPADGLFRADVAERPSTARPAADRPLSVALWTEPGIGVDPDAKQLEEHCIARAAF
jgi:O-succinylbenzoate synthase